MPANSGIWILPPLLKLKKKTLSKVDPLWKNFLDPHMSTKYITEVTFSVSAQRNFKKKSFPDQWNFPKSYIK